MSTEKKQKFGIIGLGKMGGGLATQALKKGYQIIGLDKSPLSDELKATAIESVTDYKSLVNDLETPRMIFLYVPAGKLVDMLIDELQEVLEKGDIVIDGGNSYWGDSIRRAERLSGKGIYFVDCGTSGGVYGAHNGACFMVGGDKTAVGLLEPVLRDLAVPDGFVHAGPSGAGHFVKLVHNGIEFGMLQAIGEGIDLLENYRAPLEINNILHCWNHGSVIRSWLVELMEISYKQKAGLNVPAYVEDTGEVNWLVNDALHMEVPIPVIAQSVMQLLVSRDQNKNWAKAIAMMRNGFGGHPFGEDQGIKNERQHGKVGDFPPLKKEETAHIPAS